MAGKSGGKGQKSRLSGRRGAGEARRSPPAKRQKAAGYSIKQYLQPQPPTAGTERDSSSEPEELGPSQTPAVGLLAAAVPPTGAPTAAGAKLQTALLRSLAGRFATQQALETPAGLGGSAAAGSSNQLPAAGRAAQPQPQPPQPQQQQGGAAMEEEEEEEEDHWSQQEEEDEFQIFSQLHDYEPVFLSQRPPDPAADGQHGATSQQATQTQLPQSSQQGAQPPAAADPEPDDAEWPSSQLLSQPAASQQQGQADDGGLRRVSGVSASAAHKTTPALHSSERLRCDGDAASGLEMFPLFRPRGCIKKLYIVRHGESTYNAATAKGPSWDPQIFDARLTDKGKQQAIALRKELAKLNLPPDTLWLTSPLQRAMQTLLLACPTAHLLGGGGASSSARDGDAENSSAAPNGSSERPPNVVVLPCITEKVFSTGDVGHPASHLRKLYPQLSGPLAALPEVWWHQGTAPDKLNCVLQKRFGSCEPRDQVTARIGAFRRWLTGRPESVVVAVGHSSYWRSFEGVCRGSKPDHMFNCEFRLIHF